ncbi:hypothetical protein [Halobacillus salinus]|uniref:hypothetical protein n=1 Tax=Halobacillus salinus TaxID=192814 RepID=UPI0009A74388|nr:hypothetical protein [Halobacillus salinus]
MKKYVWSLILAFFLSIGSTITGGVYIEDRQAFKEFLETAREEGLRYGEPLTFITTGATTSEPPLPHRFSMDLREYREIDGSAFLLNVVFYFIIVLSTVLLFKRLLKINSVDYQWRRLVSYLND